MHSYELTDRGKVFVSVLFVIPIFVLSLILLYSSVSSQAQGPDISEPSASETPSLPPSPPESPDVSPTSPDVTESPPPNGGGFSPPNGNGSNPPNGNGFSPPNGNGFSPPNGGEGNGPDEVDPPDEPDPSPPPQVGPIGGNPLQGTLSFLFSPELQDELDDETEELLGDFLASRGNSPINRIIVEIPQLSRDAADKVVAAVAHAFAGWGVPSQRLSFVANPLGAAEEPFAVHLSFLEQGQK